MESVGVAKWMDNLWWLKSNWKSLIVVIIIQWSNLLLTIGVTVTLSLEFDLPSCWNLILGVT